MNESEPHRRVSLATGLTYELQENLRTINHRVVDPHVSSQHRGESVCAAAQEMQVQLIYVGRVQSTRDGLRVFAELIGCPDRIRLWSRNYERDDEDNHLAIQRDIARNIFATSTSAFGDPRFLEPGSPGLYLNQRTR